MDFRAQKIAIVGCAGSGKSTLARKLARIYDLPLFHLDCLFWKPGWNARSKHDFLYIQKVLIQKEQWIIDGNYRSTMHYRINAADLIIYLDFPRYLCLFRALKRAIVNRNRNRPDLTHGCYERLDRDFFAFLKWIWHYPTRSRPNTYKMLQSIQSQKQILIFRTPLSLKNYLSSLCKKYQKNAAII